MSQVTALVVLQIARGVLKAILDTAHEGSWLHIHTISFAWGQKIHNSLH